MKNILLLLLCFSVAHSTAYIDTVMSVQPTRLIQYLPLNDATGTDAADSSGNGLDGSYTNCTLNQSGFKPNEKAVELNGTSSTIEIYSAGLNTAFDPDSGSLMLWMYSDANPWAGSGTRIIARIYYDIDNFIQVDKVTGKLEFYHKHKSTIFYKSISHNRDTVNWQSVMFTWEDSSAKIYYNGALLGEDTTYTGWDAGALDNANTELGSIGGNYFFDGKLSNFAIWDTPLSASDVKKMAEIRSYRVCGFGNSVTAGGGATGASAWYLNVLQNMLSPGVTAENKGIAGTVLQNTSAVMFGSAPQANNGRDRFDTSIIGTESDYLVILYGLNDLRANGVEITVQEYATDYHFIVDSLKKVFDSTKIVLGSPSLMVSYGSYDPWDAGTPAKQQEYADTVEAIATSEDVLFADVYTAMLNSGGVNLVCDDSIHPNDSGHYIIAQTFFNTIKSGYCVIDTTAISEFNVDFTGYQPDSISNGDVSSLLCNSLTYTPDTAWYSRTDPWPFVWYTSDSSYSFSYTLRSSSNLLDRRNMFRTDLRLRVGY